MSEDGGSITGKVVLGKRIGRTLGFPTANIEESEPIDRSRGVYAGRICVRGETYKCMVNIGSHPTLPEGEPTIEAHIIGFDDDIYGETVSLELDKYLREERRFDSVNELIGQLKRDREQVIAMEEGL